MSRAPYGLTAPIGLELSYGLSNTSSLGIVASVFDIDYAVNAQLYRQTIPKIADVFSPGLALLYGLPGLPASIGMQASYGSGLQIASKAQTHISLFLAFNMPLFIIEPVN